MNRKTNLVKNSTWLKLKQCSNDTFLLKSKNQSEINKVICENLTNDQIESLFMLISSQLDISRIKQKVYKNSISNNNSFYVKALSGFLAFEHLKTVILSLVLISRK